MKAVKLATVSVAVLLSTSAMANVVSDTAGSVVNGGKTLFRTATHPAAVSAEVGTLGYGANVAWAINDTVELQAGWAGGSFNKNGVDIDGTDFDVDADFSNPYLGVQMRPAANWLTVGAGVIVPDNDITLKAGSAGASNTYTINGRTHTVPGVVEGTIEYQNKLAPYMTVGFRPNLNNHWGVFGEVGAAYMGQAKANINSGVAAFDEDVKEAVAEETLLKWYPIVKVGATYRF